MLDGLPASLAEDLQRAVDPDILTAPGLEWRLVAPKCIRFLTKTVAGSPWTSQLALAVLVMTAYARLNRGTIQIRMYAMHARWRVLFPAYKLATFQEWNPVEHLPRYLEDTELADSFATRQYFLSRYFAVSNCIHAYLRSLLPPEREHYQQWALPQLPGELYRQLSQASEVREEEIQRRKVEADAVVPHLARIRGGAHLRWNQLKRLQSKFSEAVGLVEAGKAPLPLRFSYEESNVKQRLHFILWDRPSFVISHADHYNKDVANKAKRRAGPFSAERDHYFLEFLGADIPSNTSSDLQPDALLWFGDLLKYDLLCNGPISGPEEEVKRKQDYLRSWGYEDGEQTTPFRTSVAGLLAFSHRSGAANFMIHAQRRARGLLLQVEPLIAAATFGLAALDIFTTTGARIHELLQISLTPECLYTMQVDGIQRLLIRLVPKGSDKPADYFIGTETRRNLEKVAHLLQEHYQLKSNEPIPHVIFHEPNRRYHLLPDARPYLFQFNGQHLDSITITACMRFLCHGMVFQTPEGRTVALKAHLLRHVFAAHIHHVEQIPLDIVAFMLHHKHIRVTRYYAAPPWQEILAVSSELLDRFATQLGDLEEPFVRAPAELQRQLGEAKQQVGTLAKVLGGECTCHAICPISFACTGCVFKVPDPSRRDEIVEQREWALVRLAEAERRGLGPEIVKMRALIQHCDVELEEMKLIEQYRKDEQFEPQLQIEPRATGHDTRNSGNDQFNNAARQ